MTVAAMKGVSSDSLTAVTTGTGTVIAFPITCKNPRIIVKGVGTITAGTVILEEADAADYAGTWSQLQSIAANGLNGGKEQIYHVQGTMGFFRARISSDIVGGGTITVSVVSD